MELNKNEKILLLIGGSGVLGKSIVKIFKLNTNWKVYIIDYKSNDDADKNFVIKGNEKLYCESQLKQIYEWLDKVKFDCIMNVAGAWEGGSISSNEIFDQTEKMLNANYYPSLLGKVLFKFSWTLIK